MAVLNRISSALHLALGELELGGPHPPPVEDEGPAHRHARAGADGLERLIAWVLNGPLSPNLLAISAPISRRHSAAPGPMQVTLSTWPQAAASISTPMIDLPLTSSSSTLRMTSHC